jgi:hypothetical protein
MRAHGELIGEEKEGRGEEGEGGGGWGVQLGRSRGRHGGCRRGGSPLLLLRALYCYVLNMKNRKREGGTRKEKKKKRKEKKRKKRKKNGKFSRLENF